jgi:Ca2+-binding RTX toxin-like protein
MTPGKRRTIVWRPMGCAFLAGTSGILLTGDDGDDVLDSGSGNDTLVGDNSPVEGAPAGAAGDDLLGRGCRRRRHRLYETA